MGAAQLAPFFPHQVAVSEIFVQLHQYFKGKQCIVLTAPFDVKLHDENKSFEEDPNVVQPDILVMCDPETINEKGAYDGRPTLVVEVLSNSSKSKDIMLKSNLYMKSGIAEYWVVDTENCQVTVYSFESRKLNIHKLFSRNEIIKSYAFEGLEVDTKDIFA
jgi:Uma2 family endonuclease